MCEQCALFSLVAGKTRDSSFSCGSKLCRGDTVVRARQEPSNRENNSCGIE